MPGPLLIRTARGVARRGALPRCVLLKAALVASLITAVWPLTVSAVDLPAVPQWLPGDLIDSETRSAQVVGPEAETEIVGAGEQGESVELLTAHEPIPPGETIEEWDRFYVPPTCYTWQVLPQGLIYRDYLASVKQSRFRSVWHEDTEEGSIWDVTLGGHVGILRYGSTGCTRPTGFQIDIEGSAQIRLDRDNDENVNATDYRFGVPFSWGNEVYQTRFGYYHISSHVGDEYLDNNPGFERLNFVRETLIWGHSYYLQPDWRIYGEVGLAFISDVSEPWEFQFGTDYSPACWTGMHGAPFAAVNYHTREELGFDGNIVGQVGWAWRGSPASGLFRIGLEYYCGHDEQYSFYQNSQNKFGFGMWYDY